MSALLKNSSQFYFITTDLNGHCISANNCFREKFCNHQVDISSLSFFTAFYPEDRERCQIAIDACLQFPARPKMLELKSPSVNGYATWTKWELSAILNEEGGVDGIQYIGSDISIEKNSWVNLKEAQENYKYLFSEVPLPSWIYDPQTLKFLDVNNAAVSLYGYSKQEFLEMSILELRPQQYKHELLNILKETDPASSYYRKNLYHLKKNGDILIVEVYSSSFLFEGKNARFVTIIDTTQTIQQQKKLEEISTRLEQTNAELNEILENASEAIFKLNSDGELIYMSPEFTRLTGFSSNDMLGKKWIDFVHPWELETCNEALQKVFTENQVIHNIRYRFRHKDGSYRWFSTSAAHIATKKDEPIYGICISQDITERKFAEEALEASEERYRVFIEQSSEAIWRYELEVPVNIQTKDEEILEHCRKYAFLAECNERMADIYGFNHSGELIGSRMDDLPDLNDEKNSVLLKAFIKNNFRLTDAETRERDKHGASKYFLNNLVGVIEEGFLIRIWGTKRDITEKKDTEEKIEFLAGLVEKTTDILTTADLEFRVTTWNKAAEKIYGLKAHQVLGKSLREFFDITYQDGDRYAVRAVLQVRGEWRGEMYFKRLHDNKQVTLLANFTTLKDDQNRAIGYIISAIDITERKEAELLIKETEQRFRQMANASPVMIWMCDENNRTFYVNNLWKEFTGHSSESLMEKGWKEFVHPDDLTQAIEIFNESFKQKKPVRSTYRLKHHSGEFRWVLDIGLPRILADGNFLGYIGSIVDIHDQKITEEKWKAAEQHLKQSELFYKNLIGDSLDGILLTDDLANISFVASSITKILGFETKELMNKNFIDLIHPADKKQAQNAFFNQLSSEREIKYIVCRLPKKDKDWLWCTVRAHNMLANQYVNSVVIYIHDDTLRKEAEDELKNRELILSALARAANRLIVEENIDKAVEAAIGLIGRAAVADRVYLFEIDNEHEVANKRFEWCSKGIEPQRDKEISKNIPLASFENYFNDFKNHGSFTNLFSQLSDGTLKERWKQQGVLSALTLPVFVHGNLWGLVGFDECHEERKWKTWEIDMLKAFSSSLAGAIERKTAEQELEESNTKLASAVNDLNKIMDYSLDVICSFNENGNFTQVSAASEKVWGYKPEEVTGRNFREFIVKDENTNSYVLENLMQGSESVTTNFETSFLRKDGSLVILDWSAYWYEKEKIAFCVARDITLQKEIEKQLISSETRFRAFMNHSPAFSWITDEDGILMYLNKTSTDVLQLEYDDIGKTIFQLFPQNVAASFHQNNLSILMMNKPAETIETVPFRNGTTGNILVYLFPIQLENNGRRMVGCVAIDITDKTRAEQALRYSEQNLKAIFSSTKDAFVLLDKNLQIVTFNPVAEELYRVYTKGREIKDCNDPLSVLQPELRSDTSEIINDVLNGYGAENEIRKEFNGLSVWLHVVLQPVYGADENVEGICITISNITARKELEQKLLEQEINKQKLITQTTIDAQEKERKEIGKELHDNINQILSTTKLYLDLALNTADNSTSEMITTSLKNIMEAINEIRKLSRSLVPPTLGDLGLIESIKDLCEHFTNTKTFGIEFIHRNIRERDIADNQKLMLFRIIQEQTSNIIKHAKAKNVKIELRGNKGFVNLEITDDGKGFDLSKTRKGVGLSNIINRAELFNGQVEMITAPGKGCSIKIIIPLNHKP